MDWNRLQHTLYDLDPSDPKEDIKKLRESAGGSAQPSPEIPVEDSYSVEPGSLPAGTDSVSDFAALAGVPITEGKQKTGPAGQAKGKDKTPKTSKPSTTGEQPHPLKDKLVGEDAIDAFKTGFDNYNSPKSLSKAASAYSDNQLKRDIQTTSGRRGSSDVDLKQYAPALKKIFSDPRLKREFDDLMAKADPSLKHSSQTESIRDDLMRRLRGN